MSESSSDSYKTSVYYATIDVIISEMKERFSGDNLALMTAIDSLCPKSTSFLSLVKLETFLQHYSNCLPPIDNLENEIATFKNYLTRTPIPDNTESGSSGLLESISPVKGAFPILYNSLLIALTLGTSTASVERSFSSLRRLKTYLRSTMSEQRLDNLALLYIERDLSSTLWNSLEQLVLQFAQSHKNSRIVLI